MTEENEFECKTCGEVIDEPESLCGPCMAQDAPNDLGDMIRAEERDCA